MRGLAVIIAIAGCGSSSTALTDGAGDDDGAVTGDAPPDPCDPGTWCTEESPVAGKLLRAVWAANLDDVYAVGDGGTILHRRDNAWTAMTTPTTSDLRGVWGIDASDVWAAGNDGALLHYDGTSWTALGSLTIDLQGIWAAASDDVWITGGGSVVHWNGSQLEQTQLPGVLFAISGTGAADVWATGENAKVDHFTGTWMTDIDPGAGQTYLAILALANEVWVGGFAPGSETVRLTGATWTPHPATGLAAQGFHAAGADDIWAAGGSKAAHWDGASWTVEAPPVGNSQLFGIGGIGASFWVVGSDSLILHRR